MIDFGLSPIVATAGPSMAIPGPYWLFTVLHWLTFTLHLIAMNILFGGVIVLILFRSNPVRKELFEALSRIFPTVMAATITLGVAPLLFLQVIHGDLFYSASIIAGWNWFLIIPIVIVVYYLLYLVSMSKSLSDSNKSKLLIVAMIGFIYVSYTFTMITGLMEKHSLLPELYATYGGWVAFSPDFVETLFRWLHIVAGALVVCGIFMQMLSIHHGKLKGNLDLLKLGNRTFLHGVILATLFGLIYLFTWDVKIIKAFLGSPGFHAVLTAIVLNIIAIIFIYRVFKPNRPHLRIWTVATLIFVSLMCMVIARHSLRLIYLEGRFDASALTVNPQWSVFAMFLIAFVAGLITLYWMIRKYYKSAGTA